MSKDVWSRAATLKEHYADKLLEWLIRLLPEDLQSHALEHQGLLERQGYAAAEIRAEVFGVVVDLYGGLVRSLPTFLMDLLARLSPGYASRVYRIYGLGIEEQIEIEFQEDHYRSSLNTIRASGILVIVFYAIFGILDIWCLPETRTTAWTIKLSVCLVLGITTLLTFFPNLSRRFAQQTLSIASMAAGLGIILTIALSHVNELGNTTYYAALSLTLCYIYLIGCLRFAYALVVGICLYLSYEVAYSVLHWPLLDSQEKLLVSFNDSFFLIISLIVGATACNLFERTIRLNFLIRYAIAHSFRDFLHFFEYQNPEKFLDNIGKIRHSPQLFERFLMESYASAQAPSLLEANEFYSTTQRLLPESEKATTDEPEGNGKAGNLADKAVHIFNALLAWLRDINPTFLKETYRVYGEQALENVEKAFLRDYFQSAIVSIRVAAFYAVVFYGLFCIADVFCLPETSSVAIPIRGVICTVLAGIVYLTFREEVFEKSYQVILSTAAFMTGMGILIMLAIAQPSELGYITYYAGLMHVMLFIFLFCRLRFVIATLTGGALVVAYEGMAVFFQHLLSSSEGFALFVNNSLFLITMCFVGAMACNFIERSARLDFLTRYTIAHKSQELLAYYEHNNPTPRQLLDMINGIRHSPRRLEEFLMQLLAYQESRVR